MKNFLRILNAVLVLFLVTLIFLLGYQAGKKYDIAVDDNEQYVAISYSGNEQKIRRLLSLIDNHYVDSINTDTLVDKTIAFVLQNLDPHSVYLDKKSNQQHQLNQSYVGIGVQYYIQQDTIVITHTLPNTHNTHLLQFADKVIKVDTVAVTGDSAVSATRYIKGPENSFVNLTLIRNSDTLDVRLKRQKITTSPISSAYMLNDKMGYIKLESFSESSYPEFLNALRKLKSQGMQSLVFDLRGNPGGLMKSAEQIADEFLPDEKLIVFTQDKEGKKEYRYATQKGIFENKPVYVLVDESSASASEIIAGALQDHDLGVIIGRRTFGKGLVQREISLGDGSKLRLTTAKYYTPSGRSIQKPYAQGASDEYGNDLSERFLRGEMFSKDSILLNDSLKFRTANGKTVYGGGGIVPDKFVPIDTLHFQPKMYNLLNKSTVYSMIMKYCLENKTSLAKIQQTHFVKYYNVHALYNKILVFHGYAPTSFSPAERAFVQNYIKATMAEILYGKSGYQKVKNIDDPAVQKAIELNNIK